MKNRKDDAISPVVGVMLMLVVTIIIAAVVSAFAGGMAETQAKAPSGTFECSISNDGTWGGSSFSLTCLAVDEPIPTADVKLITQWKNSSGDQNGAEITKESAIAHYGDESYCVPSGFGQGVKNWTAYGGHPVEQNFGNYTFMAGTRTFNCALGSSESYGGYGVSPGTRYTYTDGTGWICGTDVDGMMAILGDVWYELRPGDAVKVKLVHIPTGSVIYEKDIIVES